MVSVSFQGQEKTSVRAQAQAEGATPPPLPSVYSGPQQLGGGHPH